MSQAVKGNLMETNVKAEIGVPQEAVTGEILRGRGPRRGNLEDLLRYWRPIMKKPGGFRRCVVTLMDKPQFAGRPQRICAWLHHEITGKWPNEGNKKGKGKRSGRGKLTRRVRKTARRKSFNASTTVMTKNALSIAVRESRDTKSLLTQPIAGRQNAIDYKASLINLYSSHVPVEGKTLEFGEALEIKRVGIFGSSSRTGQAVQAAGSIAIPGDLSDIRSPVRSQIYEALTPGVPGRPGTGAARRLIRGTGRGARNKFRCPPGFENGGTFTNSEFSTCGAQILRIPVGLGGLEASVERSLARLSRDADMVRSIGDLRKNRNSVDIIRAAQIPVAPKKVNATNVKKSTDYVLSRIVQGQKATDRVIRRDGVILEPVVSTAALGGLDEFDDMADGTYIATSRTGQLGVDDIAMFGTGIRDILIPIEGVGAIRLAREGGELSPEERSELRDTAKQIKAQTADGRDPTMAIREFVDQSDGRFSLSLLESAGEGDSNYTPAEESRNERITVVSGTEKLIVPRWVYETFLSRGAPRRGPNDPIFELSEGEDGGSKSASPFSYTDASRYNRRYDLKAHWFKQDINLKARGPASAVFDTNLGRYRCPPGTANGGTFTDNAGTNCGGSVSDLLVDTLSKIYDRLQRVSDRTDPLGKRFSSNPGMTSERKEELEEVSTLLSGVTSRLNELVDDVGPVKLSELGMTIQDIQVRRTFSDDEKLLANGESLLKAAGRINIFITEPPDDSPLEDATPEEIQTLINVLNNLSTAEARRRTISGSESDQESLVRNMAINSLLEEAAVALSNATSTRKAKPKNEGDILPEVDAEQDIPDPESLVGRMEPSSLAENAFSALVLMDDDYDRMKDKVTEKQDEVYELLTDVLELDGEATPSDIIDAVRVRFDLNPNDPDSLNPDTLEEQEFIKELLRDFFEMERMTRVMDKGFDNITEDDISDLNNLFARISDDNRNDITAEFLSPDESLGITNDDLRASLMGAISDSEKKKEDAIEILERQQAEKKLVRSPDVPEYLNVETVDGLSAAKKVKARQREKAKQILRKLYPNGEQPWLIDEDKTLKDMIDFDRMLSPTLTTEEKTKMAEPLMSWFRDALLVDKSITLKEIDVIDGNPPLASAPDGYTLVLRTTPRMNNPDLNGASGDRLTKTIDVSVNCVWDTEMIVRYRDPESGEYIEEVIMASRFSSDPPGDFDQHMSRMLTMRKGGSIEIDHEILTAADGALRVSEHARSGKSEFTRSFIEEASKLFDHEIVTDANTGKDVPSVKITGYGLADTINLHAFSFYQHASDRSGKPSEVTLNTGYDGAAVWSRKGFRSSNDANTLFLNRRMKTLIEDYNRNDGSLRSQIARAVIKDDRRAARLSELLKPFDDGEIGENVFGHGDFLLALDGEDGEPNAAAFYFFRGLSESFYTPQSRSDALLDELGGDESNPVFRAMSHIFDVERKKRMGNGEISESDFTLVKDEKLNTAKFTIDHLEVPDTTPSTPDKVSARTVAPAQEIRSRVVADGNVFGITPDREDMATVEAGVAFLSGDGSVADVPDSILADTLISAADSADVPRFTRVETSDTASGVVIIRDNLTETTYGIKGINGLLFPNEAAAEVIGPHVAELLGFEVGGVRFGGSRRSVSSNTAMLTYDSYPVVLQFADSLFSDWKTRSESSDPHDLSASKKSLAGMVLLDIILSHRDRNTRNYGVGDGTYFPFDYGGGLALIEGEDRAFFNGAWRGTTQEYLDSKIGASVNRMGSPYFVYPSLIGKREDLSADDLADEMISVLNELREKDLDRLRAIIDQLSAMELQEFRGTGFDRPVTKPDAVRNSYAVTLQMIEHLLDKDDDEIREIAQEIYNGASTTAQGQG